MKKLAMIAILLAITACSEKTSTAPAVNVDKVILISEFKANRPLRNKTISWCVESSDRQKTTNCENAFSASSQCNDLLGNEPNRINAGRTC